MNSIEIICTVIGAVGVVLGGVWFIIDKIFKFGRVSQRIDNIEVDVAGMKKTLDGHHEDITKIKTVLVEKYPKSTNVFSMKSSPRKLNDLGEKLYAKVNGDKFIADNKAALFDFIKNSKPLVALDVEQAANAACLSLVPTPAFNDLKDFVYNEPSWTLDDGKNTT